MSQSVAHAIAQHRDRHKDLTAAIAKVEHAPAALVQHLETIAALSAQLKESSTRITDLFERTQRERRAVGKSSKKFTSFLRRSGSAQKQSGDASTAYVTINLVCTDHNASPMMADPLSPQLL
jgi:predicted  nucleic acid-binding Zn-ribbon protein